MQLRWRLHGQANRPVQFASVTTPERIGVMTPILHHTPPPIEGGLPIGRDWDGNPFFMDLSRWHEMGLTSGTVGMIIGQRGAGKTSLLMKMGGLESTLKDGYGNRRRVTIDDTRLNPDESGKPVAEYTAHVENHLGGEHIDLSQHQLNILDPRMQMTIAEQHAIIESLCEVTHNCQLNEVQKTALTVAISIMYTEHREAASTNMLQSILSRLQFDDYNKHQTDFTDSSLAAIDDHEVQWRLQAWLDGRSLVADHREFEKAAASVAFMLLGLNQGYGGIFGAKESLYSVLSSPVVGLNLTGLDATTIPLVEMVLWAWRGSKTGRTNPNLLSAMEIHDESWSRWGSLVYARNMIKRLKHIRGEQTRMWRAMHRMSDVDQVGNQGSEARNLAYTGLKENDVFFIGSQPASEHTRLQEVVGEIPSWMLKNLTTLEKGNFLVMFREPRWRPFFIEVILTPAELAVSDTDKARRRVLATPVSRVNGMHREALT